MNAEAVLCQVDARGVASLTLNRPERGNAYDARVLRRLRDEFKRLDADPAVRVLVLRGAGRHFCVGADLKPDPAAPADAGTAAAPPVGLTDVCLALDTLAKPSIALVQGACVGGGVAFVACCDIVIADPACHFSIPEVRIGLAPAPLAPFFLRAIGARQLRHYGLTGARIDAQEAHRIGLAHHVADVFAEGALAPHLEHVLLGAPGAIAHFKQAIAAIEHQTPDPALLAPLQRGFDALRDGPEAREGKAAFAEKRRPHWYPEPPPTETP